MGRVGIAFVGCGYVADFYGHALANYPGAINLCGVYDRDSGRLTTFAEQYKSRAYATLDEALADETVQILVNLTNPDQHYGVSRAALLAGKHVYSEKPLAMSLDEAETLVALAAERGLQICGAPASVLGEAAQTLWRALRSGLIGAPRLVYSEIDDGLIHRMGYQNWISSTGVPWPAEDEFRTGCTLEHVGYSVSWLIAMFGPVRRVVSHSALLFPHKGKDTPRDYTTPDFSCGVLVFDRGVVARVTNSIIAPHDHQLRIFGEEGELAAPEIWDFLTPVLHRPVQESRVMRAIERMLDWRRMRRLSLARTRRIAKAPRAARLDFAIGIAEMAEAIAAGRPARLAGDFALHVTEVSLALQHPERFGVDYAVKSICGPMAPMEWAA